ncbi:MAG: formate/nitrite transporter family protein [Alphaproteobacteria bacterium]
MPELREDGEEHKRRRETRQILERIRLRPAVVYEIIREEGEEELVRGFFALWWSGLAAGLSMGFSMAVMGVLQAELPGEKWAGPIVAAGYSTGFLIVILARQHLFTENTITALLPVMSRHSDATTLSLLRLWGLVLAANVVGAALFALAAAETSIFPAEYEQAFFSLAEKLFANSAWEMFVKGVPAGWLVAALVWTLPSVEENRFPVIFFLAWVIGLGGFTHIIVGMVEAVFYFLKGGASFFEVLFVFSLPTLAGNMVGGSALFALISYAQVKEEAPEVTAEDGE